MKNPFLIHAEVSVLRDHSSGHQQRRSAETRLVILDAVIECLAKYGYARTTTQLICKVAKISRGAMLHHYPTKQALIAAVVDYAFYKRMENFIATIQSLSEHDRVAHNMGIQALWQSCTTLEYQAYVELHVAARTDEELRQIFLPQAERYLKIWVDNILHLFPEWSHLDRTTFELSYELVRATFEGMLINRDIERESRERVLVDFIANLLIALREGVLKFPPLPEEDAGERDPAADK